MNVESKFALRVFRSKIDFTCRRIYPFGVDYEMMDEFLHLHQDIWFVWRVVLWIGDVDRTGRKVLYRLTQNLDALAHFFDAHQITIVRVAHRPDRYIKVILFVVKIRLCLSENLIDPSTPHVWPSGSVVACHLF